MRTYTNGLIISKTAPTEEQIRAFRQLGVDNFITVITDGEPYKESLVNDKMYWMRDLTQYVCSGEYTPRNVIDYRECFNRDLFMVNTGDSHLDAELISAARYNNVLIVMPKSDGRFVFELRTRGDWSNFIKHLWICFIRKIESNYEPGFLTEES